jgi:hypothetical protein
MRTKRWLLDSEIGTKVTDFVDPLDVSYDKEGRPYVWVEVESPQGSPE